MRAQVHEREDEAAKLRASNGALEAGKAEIALKLQRAEQARPHPPFTFGIRTLMMPAAV